MRIVIDTNLLVSGVISAGLPRKLVDAAKAGEFELCTSEVLLAEFLDVIARGKFDARLLDQEVGRSDQDFKPTKQHCPRRTRTIPGWLSDQ